MTDIHKLIHTIRNVTYHTIWSVPYLRLLCYVYPWVEVASSDSSPKELLLNCCGICTLTFAIMENTVKLQIVTPHTFLNWTVCQWYNIMQVLYNQKRYVPALFKGIVRHFVNKPFVLLIQLESSQYHFMSLRAVWRKLKVPTGHIISTWIIG